MADSFPEDRRKQYLGAILPDFLYLDTASADLDFNLLDQQLLRMTTVVPGTGTFYCVNVACEGNSCLTTKQIIIISIVILRGRQFSSRKIGYPVDSMNNHEELAWTPDVRDADG